MYKNLGVIKFFAESTDVQIFTSENYWIFQFKSKQVTLEDLESIVSGYKNIVPFEIYKEEEKALCLITEYFQLKPENFSIKMDLEDFCVALEAILNSLKENELCNEISNILFFRRNSKTIYLHFPSFIKRQKQSSVETLFKYFNQIKTKRQVKYRAFLEKLLKCESLNAIKNQLDYFKKIYLASLCQNRSRSQHFSRYSLLSNDSNSQTVRKSHRKYQLFRGVSNGKSVQKSKDKKIFNSSSQFAFQKEKRQKYCFFPNRKALFINNHLDTYTTSKSSYQQSKRKMKKVDEKKQKKKLKVHNSSMKFSQSNYQLIEQEQIKENKSEEFKNIVNNSLTKWQQRKKKTERKKDEQTDIKKSKLKRQSIINKSLEQIKLSFQYSLQQKSPQKPKEKEVIQKESEKEQEKEQEDKIEDVQMSKQNPFNRVASIFIEENKKILDKYNYIGECVANASKEIEDCKNQRLFWQLPAFFLYKKFYLLRENIEERIEKQEKELKNENLTRFKEIVKEQNADMRESFPKLLKTVLKKLKHFIPEDQENIKRMLNLDFSNMFEKQVASIMMNYLKTLEDLRTSYPFLILHEVEMVDAYVISRKKEFNIDQRKNLQISAENEKSKQYLKKRLQYVVKLLKNDMN